jgi:hypothetical protein
MCNATGIVLGVKNLNLEEILKYSLSTQQTISKFVDSQDRYDQM